MHPVRRYPKSPGVERLANAALFEIGHSVFNRRYFFGIGGSRNSGSGQAGQLVCLAVMYRIIVPALRCG